MKRIFKYFWDEAKIRTWLVCLIISSFILPLLSLLNTVVFKEIANGNKDFILPYASIVVLYVIFQTIRVYLNRIVIYKFYTLKAKNLLDKILCLDHYFYTNKSYSSIRNSFSEIDTISALISVVI